MKKQDDYWVDGININPHHELKDFDHHCPKMHLNGSAYKRLNYYKVMCMTRSGKDECADCDAAYKKDIKKC